MSMRPQFGAIARGGASARPERPARRRRRERRAHAVALRVGSGFGCSRALAGAPVRFMPTYAAACRSRAGICRQSSPAKSVEARILEIARAHVRKFGAARTTVVGVAQEAGMTRAPTSIAISLPRRRCSRRSPRPGFVRSRRACARRPKAPLRPMTSSKAC